MFEDKSDISNTNEWYQEVRMCRHVPPRRLPIHGYDKAECYALSLRNAQLPGVIFFWCPFIDNIDTVVEVVEGEERGENWSHLYTAAWTSLSLENTSNPTAFRRLPLYPGSPKALFFMGSELKMISVSRKANTSLEICLETYQGMYGVLDFIPEWYMFDQWEDIPGLRTSYHGEFQTVLPEALEGRTSILSKVNLSFGMDVYKFEQILLHLINNDRLYRANSISQMRLNKLTDKSNLTSEAQSLFMNGSVILNRIIPDPHFAIVFSLDYLVGVYSCDGTVHSSQSVMVCWGAWCPFAGDIVPNGEITVPLLGGPNINPDERLAFKNSLAFRSDLPFCDQLPRIQITFICSGLEKIQQPLDISTRVNNKSQLQNLKRSNVGTTRHQLKSTQAAQNSEKMHEIKTLPSSSLEKENSDEKISSRKELKCGTTYTSVKIYGSPLVRTSNISRTSLAILAGISFTPIKDRNGNKPKVVDIENFPTADINVELNDKLDTNEIIVQFMAVEISLKDGCVKIPTSVFFTIEFYRFHTVTTERLWMDTVYSKTNLFVLKRRGNTEEIAKGYCNGFTVRYMVDGDSFPDGDEEDYINYLSNGHAIVDVWDADSLLPLGKSYIPLKFLLRRGSEAVQVDIQSAVVLSNFPEPSIITCELLLRLASVGHPCFKQMDSIRSRTNAVVSRQLTRIGQNENESYKIRAKSLNPIHENSLQRFLAAQRLDIDQRYNEIVNDAKNVGTKNLPLTTKGSMKRYLFQQELEAYKKLRDEDKASKLLKVVFKSITTEYRIYPKYGQVIFFEYMLQNTEPYPAVIVVDTAESTLKPLFDVGLWQYYKNMYGIETPLERDLYQVSRKDEQITEVHIFLKPMETICAPFIYDGFTLPQEQIKNQIIFKKKSGGEPIAILDLLIGNRHNIISNSFRFYHEAETTLSKIIHITGYKSSHRNNRVFSIRCTDPLVLTSFKNNCDGSQDLLFTCQTGKAPMLRTFTVIFFADQYYSTVLGAWLIHIHSVNQINLNAVRAQLIKIPIVLKTDDKYVGLVHFGCSSKNLEVHPSDAIAVQYGGTLNAVVHFLPNFIGFRMLLISATDERTNHLLYQWMIAVNVQEANITKMFEVYLQNNGDQTIALTVKNRYSVQRSFRISCSHPEYVRIENDIVMLSGYKATDVSIIFLLNNGVKLPEVLIFVTNVENNLQEEAYSMKLIYHD
uniref:Nephrocystin-4 n=1 Tax=Wuchereria bancrofti TaxID=6293 RepID=A0A1I8EYD5_WUCBA